MNVEVKAKIKDLQNFLKKAETLTGTPGTVIKQHDTFYTVQKGRLKLRRFPEGNGELIFYDRPDCEGPKLSSYKKSCVESTNLSDLNEVLVEALGSIGDVKKTRHLFLFGQTRIHVDEVEYLGTYMELEVCLNESQTLKEGEGIANDIMKKLGVGKEDLISGAYTDLLQKS